MAHAYTSCRILWLNKWPRTMGVLALWSPHILYDGFYMVWKKRSDFGPLEPLSHAKMNLNHIIIPPYRVSVLSYQPSTDINEPDFWWLKWPFSQKLFEPGSNITRWLMELWPLFWRLGSKQICICNEARACPPVWFKKPYRRSQQANNWDYLVTTSQASTECLTIGIAYSASCTSVVKYRLRDRMDSSRCTNFKKHGTTYSLSEMKSCRLRDLCFFRPKTVATRSTLLFQMPLLAFFGSLCLHWKHLPKLPPFQRIRVTQFRKIISKSNSFCVTPWTNPSVVPRF